MNRTRLLILVSGAIFWAQSAFADPCLDCHRNETPAAVAQWQQSAHVDTVGCRDCHGDDHKQILDGKSPVEAKVCGRCHEEAFHQHVSSRHGLGLHSGWGCTRNLADRDPRECRFCHEEGSTQPKSRVQCARFLAQSSEMGALGCNRCHQVESSCASCHTNHLTDLEPVRRPEVCATCHMGPDHPQWEMWQTSRHGVLFATSGEHIGPSCQRCHMPDGTHDVSLGITMTSGMQPFDEQSRAEERDRMLAICAECHGRGFSERELARADAVLEQSRALVQEAAEIIRDLADHDLLVPSLQDRPVHPLRGHQLVLDGQMLYEDYSHIERLFFKMKKFDLAKTVKGAFHQNPAYTHWYGNAELKMTLVDIRAEAARLKRAGSQTVGATPAEPPGPLDKMESQLTILKRQFERGALSGEEYQAEKSRILERFKIDGR